MVFASRRTSVVENEVERILREDDYTRIHRRADIRVGDIIIYRVAPGGELTHAGVVINVDPDLQRAAVTLTVMSQWGYDGEYVHREDVVPVEYGQHREYYTDRQGA